MNFTGSGCHGPPLNPAGPEELGPLGSEPKTEKEMRCSKFGPGLVRTGLTG